MIIACLCTLLFVQMQTPSAAENQQELSLSLNIGKGANLELSNGDVYAIDPDYQVYSSLWITPFKVSLSDSEDPLFPVKITNLTTGTSVNGRLLEPNEKKRLLAPRAPLPPPQPPSTELTPTTPTQPQPPTNQMQGKK